MAKTSKMKQYKTVKKQMRKDAAQQSKLKRAETKTQTNVIKQQGKTAAQLERAKGAASMTAREASVKKQRERQKTARATIFAGALSNYGKAQSQAATELAKWTAQINASESNGTNNSGSVGQTNKGDHDGNTSDVSGYPGVDSGKVR